ncbi:MAG: hypothetical protein HOP17_13010 [Acidobacteria bacterium]|nr:hypothetical protein [Acidobacteriota bacterium]
MKFSQRQGLIPVRELLRDRVSDELRAEIWNTLRATYWSALKPGRIGLMVVEEDFIEHHEITKLSNVLWKKHWKRSIDSRPSYAEPVFEEIKRYFFNCEWFRFYDLLEFLIAYYEARFNDSELSYWINEHLKNEGSAYRIIHGVVSEVTNEEEISLLEETLAK